MYFCQRRRIRGKMPSAAGQELLVALSHFSGNLEHTLPIQKLFLGGVWGIFFFKMISTAVPK